MSPWQKRPPLRVPGPSRGSRAASSRDTGRPLRCPGGLAFSSGAKAALCVPFRGIEPPAARPCSAEPRSPLPSPDVSRRLFLSRSSAFSLRDTSAACPFSWTRWPSASVTARSPIGQSKGRREAMSFCCKCGNPLASEVPSGRNGTLKPHGHRRWGRGRSRDAEVCVSAVHLLIL